jgi:hypothetical protein
MSGTPQDAGPEAPRPRADWGRVADGVFLAGLGVFFLTATVRGLPDGFWIDAVSFWPVLLVSAGIRLVFDRTVLAWGVVLGPLVVLTTLFWLAWGERPEPLPPGEWHEISANRPPGARQARVRAELAGVEVNLLARSLEPGLLAAGRAASRDRTPTLRVDESDDGETTLRLRGRQGGFLMLGTRREVWELALDDDLPLSLDLEGTFIRTSADLRTGRVNGAQVSGAFNASLLRLPPTADPVNIHLEGAFSTFDVTVPEGTPLRIQGPGFPLNWVQKGPAQDGHSNENAGYNVIVDGAFCVVDIDEGPAPEGGWPAARPAHAPTTEETRPEDTPADEDGAAPPPEDPDGGTRPPAEAPLVIEW